MKSIYKNLRYFVEGLLAYLFFGIFWLIGIKASSFLAGNLARFIGPKLQLSNIARNNLKYAMPELNEKKIEEIVKQVWENLGRIAGEFPNLGRLSSDDIRKIVKIENHEIFEKYCPPGKPGILVSGHFGNWEIVHKAIRAEGRKAALIYRNANNPFIEKLFRRIRTHAEQEAFPKGIKAARGAINVLKNGGLIGIMADQKMNDGIECKFFGKKAMTLPAPADLARKFDCDIIPLIVTRRKGVNFTLTFYEPIKTKGLSSKEIMQEINELLEGVVRKDPGQWLWLHNRWPKDKVLSAEC